MSQPGGTRCWLWRKISRRRRFARARRTAPPTAEAEATTPRRGGGGGASGGGGGAAGAGGKWQVASEAAAVAMAAAAVAVAAAAVPEEAVAVPEGTVGPAAEDAVVLAVVFLVTGALSFWSLEPSGPGVPLPARARKNHHNIKPPQSWRRPFSRISRKSRCRLTCC